ncbi:MAG: hypothetical protein ACOH2F_02340 [Cellulomonas sp.]
MRRWIARVTFALAAVLVALAGVAGLVNREVLDGPRFVAHIDQVRQDPDVAQAVGSEVADAAVASRPDLVAVKPLIVQVAASVVASDAAGPLVRVAATQAHAALTTPDSEQVVLRLADLGAVVAALLRTSSPDAAAAIPTDLPVTLSTVGGQGGVVGAVVDAARLAAMLAWLLPLLAVSALVLGVLVHPRRRAAIHTAGVAIGVGGAVLLTVAVGQQVWVASLDRSTLAGAVESALWTSFGRPLFGIAALTLLLGGLVALITQAVVPAADVDRRVRAILARAAQRPASTGAAIGRGLVIGAVGLSLVLRPDEVLRGVAVVVGVLVVLFAVDELTWAARRARTREGRLPQRLAGTGARRSGWLAPVAAASVGVLLAGTLIAVNARPPRAVAATSETARDGCNGHAALCQRRYDEVAYPAAHNAMSAQDAGFFLAEQSTGMVGLLDQGVRVLLIDTWYGQPLASGGVLTAPSNFAAASAEAEQTFGPEVLDSASRIVAQIQGSGGPTSGPVAPYLCHTFCELGGTPLLSELQGVRAWMDVNPGEVVTLFIQDAVTPVDTAATIDAAGLGRTVYRPATPDGPWPTLGAMIDNGQRLVVLMENEGGGARYPWLLQGFDHVQDTAYAYPTVKSFDCQPNRGAPDASLLLVNHWLSGFTRLYTDAQEVNTAAVLGARVERCQAERGQLPNFLAVNWTDVGALMSVVDGLNGV